MIIFRNLAKKLSLCLKSMQNRARRHTLDGTKKQIDNIKETVKKFPRIYSKKREQIFNTALKNRLNNTNE